MSRKIIGITVGTQLPKPNFKQTDPTKGDYIKNKPDFEGLKTKVNDIQTLVGDTKVSEQIEYATSATQTYTNDALSSHNISTDAHANMGWLTSEDEIVSEPAPLDADTLNGYDAAHFDDQIAVERARINAFTALGEGSTTGDAELQDIRVGYDGTVYGTAGEAVREQIGNAIEHTEKYITKKATRNLLNVKWVNGTVSSGVYTLLTHGLYNAITETLVRVDADAKYTLSWSSDSLTPNLYVHEYTSEGDYIKYTAAYSATSPYTFQTGETTTFVRIATFIDNVEWQDTIPNNFQMELGNNASAYIKPIVIGDDELDVGKIAEEQKAQEVIPSDNYYNLLPQSTNGTALEWEEGGIDAQGVNQDVSSYLRTPGYIQLKAGDVFKGSSKYFNFAVYEYNPITLDFITTPSDWVNEYTVQNDCFGRVKLPSSNADIVERVSRVELIRGGRWQTQFSSLPINELRNLATVVAKEEDKDLQTQINDNADAIQGLSLTSKQTIGRVFPNITWETGSTTGNSTDTTRIRTNFIKSSGGVIRVYPPEGYNCVLRTYPNADFSSYIYDTGWKTTQQIELEVESGLYCVVCLCAGNFTDEINTEIGEQVKIYMITNPNSPFNKMEEKVNELTRENIGLLLSNTVKTIAHRGNDIDAPECVKPAYIAARKRGHTIAENDVNKTSDGVYICWHDVSFSKLGTQMADINGYILYTDGNGNYYWYDSTNSTLYASDYTVSNVSASELTVCNGSSLTPSDLPYVVISKLDVGKWFNTSFAGTTILTFDEWVLLCKQLGMEIYIDTKISYTDEDVENLVSIVRKYGMLDKASWLNIGYSIALKIREHDANARLVLLYECTEGSASQWKELNKSGRGVVFNGDAKSMTYEGAQRALNNGYQLEYWFVDYGAMSQENIFSTIRTAIRYGAQALTLDKYRVDEAFAYLLE